LVSGPSGWGSGFISWWIAEDGYADLSRAGVIRWFVRVNEKIHWADTRDELLELFPGKFPKSVTFIPATVYDNKKLLENNPEYLANLEAQPLVDRERFLGDRERGGNWKIRAEAGKVFNRDWFEIVEAAPTGGVEGSGWDFAATEKSLKNNDPDYTARVKIRKVRGTFYILDMFMERYAAGEIDNLILTTSQADRMTARSQGVQRFVVRWEIEPGSAGQRVNNSTMRLLAGFEATGVPITGDKVTRAKPMAAQALAGNIKLVAGAWNDTFLALFHAFPDARHDDPIDAASVIFNALADLPEPTPPRQDNQRRAMREVFNS
jgi:predicted phage terminase large subunit-like protein